MLEPKGTLGIVIMSNNAPVKVLAVWPWHYGEPALYIMESQSSSNILFVLLNPKVPFGSSMDY